MGIKDHSAKLLMIVSVLIFKKQVFNMECILKNEFLICGDLSQHFSRKDGGTSVARAEYENISKKHPSGAPTKGLGNACARP